MRVGGFAGPVKERVYDPVCRCLKKAVRCCAEKAYLGALCELVFVICIAIEVQRPRPLGGNNVEKPLNRLAAAGAAREVIYFRSTSSLPTTMSMKIISELNFFNNCANPMGTSRGLARVVTRG